MGDEILDRCFFCQGEGYFPPRPPHICPGCRKHWKLPPPTPEKTAWEALLEEDGL